MKMNENNPKHGISRRGFLSGTAGVTLAAALPTSYALRGAKPVTTHAKAATAARQAVAPPVNGATIYPFSYGQSDALKDAKIADGYFGLPLAETLQKIYLQQGTYGTVPPKKMTQLAVGGCQFVVSVKPEKLRSKAHQQELAAWLTMMNGTGLNYRCVLYSEFNDKAFTSESEWLEYWSYYAPVIKDAGVVCGIDPGCNINALPKAIHWFPSNPVPDELWMDYYSTAWRGGARIDKLLAVAKSAGIQAGLAEWGWFGGVRGPTPMTMNWYDDYCNYLISLAQQGSLGLGSIFYGGLHGTTVDVVTSAADPRIPKLQAVCNAIANAAKPA